MFWEYLQFWKGSHASSVSFDLIKSGALLAGIGLLLAFAGFKIKGVWGAVVALLLGTGLYLYLKGMLHLF